MGLVTWWRRWRARRAAAPSREVIKALETWPTADQVRGPGFTPTYRPHDQVKEFKAQNPGLDKALEKRLKAIQAKEDGEALPPGVKVIPHSGADGKVTHVQFIYPGGRSFTRKVPT